jgi:DNA primase
MERDLQSIKDEVRTRTDIVELIGNYTRLKKAGKNWTGLCPFHSDKRPSFSVSADVGYYRCWSCGEQGDIFTFVQKKENLDFIEALEWLARRAGVPFERGGFNPEKRNEREEMIALNDLAVQFFQDRLTKSQDAKDYIVGRALLKATCDQWDIGFAPPEWEALADYLAHRRANLALAAKIGLIKTRKQEGSGYYDTFRNRIIFPIRDINGRVIAFGGRAMSSDEPAKYLNSEQSELFDKSRTLYGLYFARKKLGTDTPPVFVEGYVDVITAHQAGFTQCVATLGTSMTEDHARMLARYSPRVIICYDSDNAGIKATLRGAEVWEKNGVEGAEVRVARLPDGDDPDSILRRGETAAFQLALDNAVPRVDFEIELALKRHDLKTEEGRLNALNELVPIFATVKSLAGRGKYADKFAYLHPLYGRFGIARAIEQIMADIEIYSRQTNNAQSPRDRGYPLSQDANRGQLAEQPPPPTYKPPTGDNWGKTQPPYQTGYQGRPHTGERRGNWSRNKKPQGPPSDPSVPPAVAPALTGAEKAERQILRAAFSPQWRTLILSRLSPELLVTPHGKQLYNWLARTPANSEGGIDAAHLLHQIEDSERELPPVQNSVPFFAEQEGIPAFYGENPVSMGQEMGFRLSEFLRSVLEGSVALAANEELNADAVTDCIERLRVHRDTQMRRELSEMLQQPGALSDDQRRAFLEQYYAKLRERKGSPPPSEDD